MTVRTDIFLYTEKLSYIDTLVNGMSGFHWDVVLIIFAIMTMIFWDLLGASEPTRDWTLELLFDWDTPTT